MPNLETVRGRPAPRLGSAFPQADDLYRVRRVLAKVAPGWSVAIAGDDLSTASLMIVPPAADDALGPTFVLYCTGSSVQMDQVHWDEYSKRARFSSLTEALLTLRTHLVNLVTLGHMTSATRH